jgi:hypothetical protein
MAVLHFSRNVDEVYSANSHTMAWIIGNTNGIDQRTNVYDKFTSTFCERCQSVGLPTQSDKSVEKREDCQV